jgi:hypothetical protein
MGFTRISLIIAFMFSGPAAACAAGPGVYYFIAVQNGAYNFKGGEEQLQESYKALQGMVKLADAQNARLTLLFSAQYAVYIATDPARLAELDGWKKTGHEIGAYHQGPETRAWDGYSDLPEEELSRLRKKEGKSAPAQGHHEYFEALGRLEPGIRSGCMLGGTDKKFLEAAPVYEVCCGEGQMPEKEKSGAGQKGINEALSVFGEGDKAKKRLSCFHPADKAGIGAAKEAFTGMSLGAYGASFKSSPAEFGAFYSWLAFLRSVDPQGLRSHTAFSVVNGKLLPEKQAVPVAAVKKIEKKKVQPKPEPPPQEIPRLQPVPSKYGKVGSLVPERELRRMKPQKRGYCGDGICDAFERAHPGRCPGECVR